MDPCFQRRCGSHDVEIAVSWKTDCPHATTYYCDRHRARFEQRGSGVRIHTCGMCGAHIQMTGIWPVDAYSLALAAYMKTGFIADKEALVSLVTLDYPPDWDIYGSILVKPAVMVPTLRLRRSVLAGLVICAGLVAMLLWL